MKEYKLTLAGLAISIITLIGSLLAEGDLFEYVVTHLEKLESYELDEFIIPALIFFVFVVFDVLRRQKTQTVELEKIKIYKAMLRSAHHVLNNFLNQMQLFKFEAQNNPDFNPEILNLYDQIMKDASMQIEALGSIERIDEVSILDSVAPKSNSSRKTP